MASSTSRRRSSSSSSGDGDGAGGGGESNSNKGPTAILNPNVVEFSEEDVARTCHFCHQSVINKLMLGPMYSLEGVTVHYFCMLFSAGLSQHGEDNEGILGFMPVDIRKEIHRGRKIKCKFCKKNNATVGCSTKKCKMSFHFPCGLDRGVSFQFLNNYESYCEAHKRRVRIPLDPNLWECPICYGMIEKNENPLFTICCKKGVLHRLCLMKMADAHGSHFFKCPLCNDKEIFSEHMRFSGIYVPERDAVWELEPNAFSDLNQMHNRCDAVRCLCPQGREYNSKTKSERDWRIVRCGGCGAEAVHKRCGNLSLLTYRCDVCASVLAGAPAEDPESEDDDDDDDDDEDEDSGMPRRRRQTTGHTPSRRIIRRGLESEESESDEEMELPSSRIRNLTARRNVTDSESDTDEDSDGSSSSSSCSFVAVTKNVAKAPNDVVPMYGKKYQILGHHNDDDNTDSDDSDYNYLPYYNNVNHSTTGTSDGQQQTSSKSNQRSNNSASSSSEVDRLNDRSRDINFYKEYCENRDKMAKLQLYSAQIAQIAESGGNGNTVTHGSSSVGQGRPGVVANMTSFPEERLTELLKKRLNRKPSIASGRQLRSSARLPNAVKKNLFNKRAEPASSTVTSETIDRVTNLFTSTVLGHSQTVNTNTRLTRSRSKSNDSNKSGTTDESPQESPIAVQDPIIQKIVQTFQASALTIIPLAPEKPSTSNPLVQASTEEAGGKKRTENASGPQPYKIPKRPLTEVADKPDMPPPPAPAPSRSFENNGPSTSWGSGAGVSSNFKKNPFYPNYKARSKPQHTYFVTAKKPPPMMYGLDPNMPPSQTPYIETTDDTEFCITEWDTLELYEPEPDETENEENDGRANQTNLSNSNNHNLTTFPYPPDTFTNPYLNPLIIRANEAPYYVRMSEETVRSPILNNRRDLEVATPKPNKQSTETDDNEVILVEDVESVSSDSDDDDVKIIENATATAPKSTEAKPNAQTKNSDSDDSEDDDIEVVEVVNIVPPNSATNAEDCGNKKIKSEPESTPLATAFLEISQSTVSSSSSSLGGNGSSKGNTSQNARHFCGRNVTGMSAALIAMSSSDRKVNVDSTKTGNDPESHEVVIVLSDDEEDRSESPTSPTLKTETEPTEERHNPVHQNKKCNDSGSRNQTKSGKVSSADYSMQPTLESPAPPPPEKSEKSVMTNRNKRGRDVVDTSLKDNDDNVAGSSDSDSESGAKRAKFT